MSAEDFVAELVIACGIGLALSLLVKFGVSLMWAPYLWLRWVLGR